MQKTRGERKNTLETCDLLCVFSTNQSQRPWEWPWSCERGERGKQTNQTVSEIATDQFDVDLESCVNISLAKVFPEIENTTEQQMEAWKGLFRGKGCICDTANGSREVAHSLTSITKSKELEKKGREMQMEREEIRILIFDKFWFSKYTFTGVTTVVRPFFRPFSVGMFCLISNFKFPAIFLLNTRTRLPSHVSRVFFLSPLFFSFFSNLFFQKIH